MNLWDKVLWKILNRKAWNGFIEIEISGRCNARCKYCCTGRGRHVGAVPYMKAEKFAEIMAHLKKIGVFLRGKWGKGQHVFLFNWTEPTLNPELDEILSILGRYDKVASISSNFIAPWTIAPESYQHLCCVIFSLCSLQEERYGRIFGANLQTTLKNFKDFLEMRKKYHPTLSVNICWHQYRWNDDELEEAKAYFTGLVGEENFIFNNCPAYFHDLSFYLNYCRSGGRDLSGYALEDLEHDFAWEKMHTLLDQRKECCPCPWERSVVITETGQLTQCCMVASEQESRQMGDILTMTLEDILRAKKNDPICQECKNYCIPYFSAHWLSEADRAVVPSDNSCSGSCTNCSSCED